MSDTRISQVTVHLHCTAAIPARHSAPLQTVTAQQRVVMRPRMYGDDMYFVPERRTSQAPTTQMFQAPEGRAINPLAAFLNWLLGEG